MDSPTSSQPGSPPDSPRTFAYYYPEGAGYLHVRDLTEGTQGAVALVQSCADGKLYVRKRDHLAHGKPEEFAHQFGCAEVYLYRPHPLIPKLIDWTVYRPLQRSDAFHYAWTSTSTIWELCTGGDVQGILYKYVKLNQRNAQFVYSRFPYPHHFPEAFIWKMFGQLIQAVSFIHCAQPLIRHCDIFGGNVFLRPSDDGFLPDCFLGDFGKGLAGAPTYRDDDQSPEAPTRQEKFALDLSRDYNSILITVKQLMTLEPNAWHFDSQGNPDSTIIDAVFSNLEIRSTGADGPPTEAVQPGDGFHFPSMPDHADRDRYQLNVRASGKRYSPLLFDTIRQFDQRVQLMWNPTGDPVYFANEDHARRDWTYLGKAIEARAWQRMGQSDDVLYPPLDEVWHNTSTAMLHQLDADGIQRQILRTRAEVTSTEHGVMPVGPFRIAEVDVATSKVVRISRETYNTFHARGVQGAHGRWLGDRIRSDRKHSVPLDPTQGPGIIWTRALNRSVLNGPNLSQ